MTQPRVYTVRGRRAAPHSIPSVESIENFASILWAYETVHPLIVLIVRTHDTITRDAAIRVTADFRKRIIPAVTRECRNTAGV